MSAELPVRTRLIARLVEDTAALYRPAGRFAYFFARSKLRHDPLFATLLRTDAIGGGARVVDLGCGQGLLGAWFASAGRAGLGDDDGASRWSIDTYCGIDQSRRDVARARVALPGARIIEADLRGFDMATVAPCDVMTLFDVLHYFQPDAQERLLRAAHAALHDGGALVLRVGEGAFASSSRWANLVDLIVCALRGHPRTRLHRRPIAAWIALLDGIGFAVEVLDGDPSDAGQRSGRPSFTNVLLRATKEFAVPADARTRRPATRGEHDASSPLARGARRCSGKIPASFAFERPIAIPPHPRLHDHQLPRSRRRVDVGGAGRASRRACAL